MKLRFHANTLRLRLSRSDVARLAETGSVEETVAFPGRSLTYAIVLRPSAAIAAAFDGGRIEVTVPREAARNWMDSDQTAIENAAGSPGILLEKDFKCLHGDASEGAEAFPNPLHTS